MNSGRGNSRYVHPTVADELAANVSLHLDRPVECILKFDRGLRRDTKRGPRVLFTLTNDMKLWVDPPVADRIEAQVAAGEPFWICKRKEGKRDAFDVWTGERAERHTSAWENNFEDGGDAPGSADEYRPGPVESRLDRDASDEMIKMARTIDQANARKKAARERQERAQRIPEIPAEGNVHPRLIPALEAAARRQQQEREEAPEPHPAWKAITERTIEAVDALAAVRKHAEQYGHLITSEDARSLLCTIIIGRQQRGGAR